MSRYHFVAIGGAVMHNLALELKALGNEVSGSDDEIFDPAKSRLFAAGILPESYGWFPEKITKNIDAIILGMHAKSDNPELLKAQELGLKIFSFPEFIFHHSQNKMRIVIAGSHGKTTSTAMLMHILKKNNVDADYLVGSLLPGFDRMVRLSDAPVIVIEGDEYLTSPIDRTPKFWHYKPHFSMITGIAWDHVNVFPTFDNYIYQFDEYLKTISEGYFYYANDVELEKLALKYPDISQAYAAPNYEIREDGVEVSLRNEKIMLNIFGKHNIENAAGVVQLAIKMGIDEIDAWKSLSDFPGTAKRLEKVFENDEVLVIRDFAHAPSKVKASVSAVREQYPTRNFIAVFELHTFSSLMPEFMGQYHQTMDAANQVFVLFDPHVFELKRMPVPSAETIQQRLGNVEVFSDVTTLQNCVKAATQKGQKNVLLLMSSGNLGGSQIEDFID